VRSLQREAVRDQIFDTVHFTTVADILRTADLQPHRFGYWKTTVWDQAAIKQDIAEGNRASVSGTPAFFINGRLLSGAQPFAAFKAAIDAELGNK